MSGRSGGKIAARRLAGAIVAAGVAVGLANAPASSAPGTQAAAGEGAPVANGDLLIGTNSGLYLLSPDGSRLRRLADVGEVWAYDGRFSPDGTKVVYVDESTESYRVVIMNADGSGKRLLASDAWNPSFSRDGSRVAFIKTFYDGRPDRVESMDARPGAPRTTILQDGPKSPRCAGGGAWPDGSYADPVWSPVGDRLAVVQRCAAGAASTETIWIVGPRGNKIAGLRSDGTQKWNPDFSPDGRWIVYTAHDRNRNGSIEVVDRKTGAVKTLLDRRDKMSRYAAWSPDGARIATTMKIGATGRFGVYTMRASDGGDRRLVRAFGRDVLSAYPWVLDWRAAS